MAIENEINNQNKYVHSITNTVVEIVGEGHDKTAVVKDPGDTNLKEGQEISHTEVLRRNSDWKSYQ